MVFNRKNDRILTSYECILIDSFNYILERKKKKRGEREKKEEREKKREEREK